MVDLRARRELGSRGERQVAEWYRAQGYEVAASNWRCSAGEIDLVLRRGATVVFCEVKARSSLAFGAPVEAVTRAKQARLRKLAARWLEEGAPVRAHEIRFDVASVMGSDIDVVESAF